ncbi:MAG: ATP-binding protein, partial [Candidatus Eremiobacteraeota bacterium]|nr:ATP-binding protein [Candidatus Eremiobacteraeota bacterium]
MRKLPIGIQNFKELRTENYYYVDKTPFVKQLVEGGKYYFLSRPRRFGKSLFLNTLKQAFSGNKPLFEGLYLEKNWDWNIKYPVIHISFGSGVFRTLDDLKINLKDLLLSNASTYNLQLKHDSINLAFKHLIQDLHRTHHQKVVVLIDEYDKPILDNLTHPEIAREIREELKNLYSVIKDSDEYLKFAFLTGVSKFSKVSIFSGLNNLKDITLDSRYASLCGYTEKELVETFQDRLQGVNLEEVRNWYNGYSWLGEKVYNPFDILLYLDTKIFQPYWFETGTPTFLIQLIQEKKYYLPNLENLKASELLLGSFEIERIPIETLLFQTGYLTITGTLEFEDQRIFQLTYPNKEVKISLMNTFLEDLLQNSTEKENAKLELYEILNQNQMARLKIIFHRFFASIPYEWYTKNNLSSYEGFYASIVYAYFTAAGLKCVVEDSTSKGKLDMAVFYKNRCYLFEFKVVELEPEGKALEQIKRKKYEEKYRGRYEEIYLIGVEFSAKERNVLLFEWEK